MKVFPCVYRSAVGSAQFSVWLSKREQQAFRESPSFQIIARNFIPDSSRRKFLDPRIIVLKMLVIRRGLIELLRACSDVVLGI